MEKNVISAQAVIETPLAAFHRATGAEMGAWFGCALPDEWDNPLGEQRFAINSVALIDKNYRAYLSFTGPDRVRYLNAVLTNNIKDLRAAQGNASLLLNPQGHILAEIETYSFPDELFCVSYAMIRQQLIEWLEKYIIMDDVTMNDETQRFGTLALEGPQASAIVLELTGLDLAKSQELSTTDAMVFSLPCRVVKRSPGNVAGAEFVVAQDMLESLWRALLDAARKHGGGPMGYKALSAQRLVQAVPWFGYDFGERQIPHEAGLEDSHISYTKGCYTGQEIVERVRSRGHVNRRRVEFLFSGEGVPEPGAALKSSDTEVGYVTSAARAVQSPKAIGMGYVRKENGALGSNLEWERGTATVVKLQDTLDPAASS
jgi:folate-binding protein YgfZ